MKKFNYVKISPINGIVLYVHVYESIIGVPEAMKIYRSQISYSIATVYIHVYLYCVAQNLMRETHTMSAGSCANKWLHVQHYCSGC